MGNGGQGSLLLLQPLFKHMQGPLILLMHQHQLFGFAERILENQLEMLLERQGMLMVTEAGGVDKRHVISTLA